MSSLKDFIEDHRFSLIIWGILVIAVGWAIYGTYRESQFFAHARSVTARIVAVESHQVCGGNGCNTDYTTRLAFALSDGRTQQVTIHGEYTDEVGQTRTLFYDPANPTDVRTEHHPIVGIFFEQLIKAVEICFFSVFMLVPAILGITAALLVGLFLAFEFIRSRLSKKHPSA